MTTRLYLDTSAILAYTRGSIHVGEPMAEVDTDGGVVGLPALCLAEASWMVDDPDRLALLSDHRATRGCYDRSQLVRDRRESQRHRPPGFRVRCARRRERGL